jgi:hypothetical protein
MPNRVAWLITPVHFCSAVLPAVSAAQADSSGEPRLSQYAPNESFQTFGMRSISTVHCPQYHKRLTPKHLGRS